MHLVLFKCLYYIALYYLYNGYLEYDFVNITQITPCLLPGDSNDVAVPGGKLQIVSNCLGNLF